MSKAEVAPEAKKSIQPLPPSSLMFEDSRVVRHVAFVDRNTDPAMLTESRFWLSVAQRLTPLARVMVFWDDRSAMAELMCTEASQSFVSMLLLDYRKLPGIISDGSEALVNFEIFYSQLDGYCCRRLSDGVLIVQGASSKEKAIEQLKSHPSFKTE
ncbi:hypothetical protein [Pseudomonas fluorescens]|uniref:hypothetical protein n=1 Tax=Pseudomonas fluorescens TaxID=294 RepID=UPI00177C740B|nr:hypothetical protein [Pseudomonas fluorescens]